jgi:hypothetical protein
MVKQYCQLSGYSNHSTFVGVLATTRGDLLAVAP